MIPGSNILNMALSVIASQTFQYYAYYSRATQRNGQYLSTYLQPISLQGSVQPVPRNLYYQYGLDFSKNYLMFYVSKNAIDVQRDISGDLMDFAGNTYQCVQESNWFPMDGWTSILCVQIQNVPLVTGVSAPPAANYVTDQVLTFVLSYNEGVVVTGTPSITLSAQAGLIHGNADYVSGSGSMALTFSYTVQAGDTAAGITCASPVAGAIKNSMGTIPANSSFIVPDLSGVTLNA